VFLCGSFEILPRKRSFAEIDDQIAQSFQVVTPGLFDTEMGVNRGVSGSSSQSFVLAVGNVPMRFGVEVHFSETKINDINSVAMFADSHEEIFGLNVAMDKRFCMNILNATNLKSQ